MTKAAELFLPPLQMLHLFWKKSLCLVLLLFMLHDDKSTLPSGEVWTHDVYSGSKAALFDFFWLCDYTESRCLLGLKS